MNEVRFTTIIGPDGVIHPPAGVEFPQGEIEVSVRPQTTACSEERLRATARRRGLNPDTLDDVTRAILRDEIACEDRGTVRPRPAPGAFKGVITYIAPDFDAPLEDMKEYME